MPKNEKAAWNAMGPLPLFFTRDHVRLPLHEYDVAFKLTLQEVDLAIRELTGRTVARRLNVELPEVRNTRVDLLGETASGELAHIELQSLNDPAMPLRMAEYCLPVLRLFGRFPHQVLVYVGEAQSSMEAELNAPALKYSYRIVDIRELNGERLLAGLRKLGQAVEEKARTMPILNDILDHEVLGREYKRGLRQGELTVLRRQIEKRFGAIPAWAEERFVRLSPAELENLSVRLLEVSTIGDLLR